MMSTVGVTLGPGFNLHVIPSNRFKTITLRFVLRTGLGAEATGIALLESILRRGCRGYPNLRVINRFLESMYGARMATSTSKIGEQQTLETVLRVLNDKFAPRAVRSLSRGLDFVHRLASAPLLEKGTLRGEYVAQEKTNHRRYLEGLINERGHYAMLQCVQRMCADEPFGTHEYGRLEQLDRWGPRTLTDLHSKLLATAPIDLFVAGDVNPVGVRRTVGRIFKRLIRRKAVEPLPVEPTHRTPDAPRDFTEKMEVEQARLILGWRTQTSWREEEYPALIMLDGLFGGFSHSRLFSVVREREGLAYQAGSSLERTKGLLFAVLGVDADAASRARDLTVRQLESIAKGEISADEFSKTRNVLLHYLRSRGDSPEAMIHSRLLGVVNGRERPAGELMMQVRSVTPAAVARAAGRLKLDTVYLLRNP